MKYDIYAQIDDLIAKGRTAPNNIERSFYVSLASDLIPLAYNFNTGR
jgi:hypothetical protein